MNPTIAIVLHFRNAARTHRCIASLSAAGVERVTIVDNSADEGASLCELKEVLTREEAGVVSYLEPGINLGFAGGVNLALAETARPCQENVLLLNSDAVISGEAINSLEEALHQGAVLAAPMIMEGGSLKSPACFYHGLLGLITRRPIPFSRTYLTGACLMVHGDFVQTPLFDPSFFFFGEDVLLSHRVLQLRHATAVTTGEPIRHEGSGSSVKGSVFYEYHINRAHLLLAARLYEDQPLLKALAFACRIFILPVRAMWRSLKLNSASPLVGMALACSDIVRRRIRPLTPPRA
ncbi:glycosyltransferase family 2 protein [Stenotrophomonas sp. S39]|uniref:glycosyltransferase family 2 protein n=1 Tax=Stenotrophomonas sp. S39 TaxID=2767451 RepID=UPI001909D1FB|nr:glycosyltransferase family 2 protein [Stenotrophomonas sp. S39]MBK0053338.1 glycosyltransferase family 2 protein [Stenotrophomonas sp. S39]